jgi:crotonobetainyl-CoA:carnitine CoA-transferase CaiB-like acyl-CoA transferase
VSGPLAGVRVVEIPGGIASGFATRQLAGYGAAVTCVDGLSDLPPLTEHEAIYLRANKELVHAADVDVRQLALTADIVVEEGTPGRLPWLPVLRDDNPGLVVTSISPFGQTGPYAQYQSTNAVSFAMGGIMSLTGDYFREPLVSGGSQAQYFGGLHAFAATVTAYLGAVLHGEGDWLDISLQECAAGTLELYGPATAYTGTVMPRMGNQTRAEWGIYPCRDGYVGVFALQRQIPALLDAMGVTEPAYLDPMFRTEHTEELVAEFFVFTTGRTKAELLEIGRKHRVPIGVALTPADLLGTDSLDSRRFWDEVSVEGRDEPVRVPGRSLDGLGWR